MFWTLALLLSSPITASAQTETSASLYDQILDVGRREQMIDARGVRTLEPNVEAFLAGIRLPFIDDVTAEDIRGALDGSHRTCVVKNLSIFGNCALFEDTVRRLAERELRVRTLGRDLRIIASGFEEAILGGEVLPLTSRARGLSRMWSADSARFGEAGDERATRVRSQEIPDSPEMGNVFSRVGELLNRMDPDSRAAAVGRYEIAGVRWVRAHPHDSMTGTEQELRWKQWQDIELTLDDVLAYVMDSGEIDIDLSGGEAVLFAFHPALQRRLPPNIQIWAHAEEDGGDIGIRWVHAVETVQPTLCSPAGTDGCTGIPGGRYAASADEEQEKPLCALPLMRIGYLCMGLPEAMGGRPCREQVEASSDSVRLSPCTSEEPERVTGPGGEACMGTAWQINPQEDDDLVCTPERLTRYRNTIGNTMCFLNRCWLQSLSQHRLIPGRVPMGPGDNAFPFDACILPDPQLGTVVPTIQLQGWLPPPYRPEMLVRSIETFLCPGLPPGSPFCAFDPNRRLTLPPRGVLALAGDILNQDEEFHAAGARYQELSDAVSMRIARRIYGEYVRRRAGALGDMATAAAHLLTQFTRASFPTAMCPFNDTGDNSLLDSPLCGARPETGDQPVSPDDQ